MITIKIEEKIPYSDESVILEQSIDDESYYNLRNKGEVLADMIFRMKSQVNDGIDKEMQKRGIVLNDEGLLIT
jgi:hypothetical protein